MASISATHKSWAKLIIDTIEQQETDEQHVAVYQKNMSSKDTRAGAIRAATKGIRTILLSKNPPFVEVSRAAPSNKFEEELEILRNYFVRNPTPAARFDLNDSEDDDASEVVILGVNQQQPPEQQQQQPFQQQQQQQQQPFQQHQQQQQPFHQ
jgi:hypothetical protein